MVNGGSGIWNGTDTNWTDADGARADAWGSKFAVFQTNPDLVTIDGGVSTTGMQFIGEGWQVEGDAITLVGDTGATAISVGAGPAPRTHGAPIDATLSAPGARGEEDGSTWILQADNGFAGGT